MTIHHATIKAAAAKGFILTQDGDRVCAHHTEANVRVEYTVEDEGEDTNRAKDAWAAAADIVAFHAEHPAIRIRQIDGDFVAFHHAKGKDGDEIARDPEIEDLFETLNDPEVVGADEADDEEKDTGSVVPPIYKQRYKERGDATNCGDWLAKTLNSLCQITDGKKVVTDLDRLEAIAASNGVETPRMDKLGKETNGWQGRYRMTIRNMLTKRIAAKGFLFVPEGCGKDSDTEIPAPAEWIAEHTPKGKPAKQEKAAVQKDEGAGKKSKKTLAKEKADRVAAVANDAIKSAKAKRGALL